MSRMEDGTETNGRVGSCLGIKPHADCIRVRRASLSLSFPPNRRNGHHSFSPTNFHLSAALRTRRTLGGSGTPPEIPGRPPRGRSASAGAAGSSALRRWPPLRSWPLVVWEAKEKKGAGRREFARHPKVGHASKILDESFGQSSFRCKGPLSDVLHLFRLVTTTRHARIT